MNQNSRPIKGREKVSRGTTLVDRSGDPLRPTAKLRSVPLVTLGVRSVLIV